MFSSYLFSEFFFWPFPEDFALIGFGPHPSSEPQKPRL
jgi:hypothetical protein